MAGFVAPQGPVAGHLAILGFIIFGIISWIGPNRDAGFDINYDPEAALGYMSVLGMCLGALVGAAVAALFTYRK